MMPRRTVNQDGLSLVELLVVLVILAIVGTIVASGIVRGLQTDAETRSRIEVFEDMQVVLERMSREVRGANPVLPGPTADTLSVQVFREDACLQFTYTRSVDELRVQERRSSTDCDGFDTTSEQLLFAGVESSPFTYRDHDGEELTGSFDPEEIASVGMSLVRTPFQQRPVEVSTVVALRNN